VPLAASLWPPVRACVWVKRESEREREGEVHKQMIIKQIARNA
jgi:hypothetical protein